MGVYRVMEFNFKLLVVIGLALAIHGELGASGLHQ